jgi:tetratricopeptide (TPR) repeat protein
MRDHHYLLCREWEGATTRLRESEGRKIRRGAPGEGNSLLTKRQWCVPTALLSSPGVGALEASDVLTETSGPTALLLWLTVRDVHLWGSVDPDQRSGLFRENAADLRLSLIASVRLPARVEGGLRLLADMLRLPEFVSTSAIVAVCLDLASWSATDVGPCTAIAFAQSAAMADANSADSAFATAKYALAAGQLIRAESWFRRVIAVSRRGNHWECYVGAYFHLSAIFLQQGRHSAMKVTATKVLRASRRYGVRGWWSKTLYLLHLSARARGDSVESERYAYAAFRRVPYEKKSNVALVLDLGRWWADSRPRRARKLLAELLARVIPPRDRAVALALMARAAAAMADRTAFDEAWAETHRLLRSLPDASGEAETHLAHAAAVLHIGPHADDGEDDTVGVEAAK